MDDFAKQVTELHAQTQESRYQFLKAELVTCFTAIDVGNSELERGNREFAESEVRNADKGYDTILRFLPGLDSQERRDEIKTTLPMLRKAVDELRNQLGFPK